MLEKRGCFMCLELSKVNNLLIGKVCDVCSFDIIPASGQITDESIRKFSPQEKIAQIICDAGFNTVGKVYEDLTFGIVAIHSD